MQREYHAQRRRQRVGPFATREEAVAAFVAAFPFTGPDYMAQAPRNKIMSGYGNGGAYFDLRWNGAKGN